MSITIDATIAGATANSYNTIAAIDAYAQAAQPSDAAAWAALTTDDAKAPFVVRATRILDTIPFAGLKVGFTQALQWPRVGVEAPIGLGWYGSLVGYYYRPDEIPPAILEAHAKIAIFLAVNASADPFSTGDAGPLSALKVGAIDLTFRPDAVGLGRDFIEREIYPVLAAGNCSGGAHGIRLTR